jgi:hypothetical protein
MDYHHVALTVFPTTFNLRIRRRSRLLAMKNYLLPIRRGQ